MALAEGVAAGGQGHGLFIVHGHAGKRLTDVTAGGHGVRVPVGPFRVHVDQAHLHRGQRVFQFTLAAVTLVPKPFLLGTPVDILFRLPHVLAPAAETEGLKAHRLQGTVAGQDHQVRPGNPPAVFLLDRPEQPTRLVEVGVVRPAVEGRKALGAGSAAPAAVGGAVGARAVPGHADEQRPVVTVVGRPPILRVGHQRVEILLHRRQVQLLELLGVVEALAHGIARGRVLVEDPQVQLVRPPVPVGRSAAGDGFVGAARHRALALDSHDFTDRVCVVP